MPSAYASFARSGPARYLVCSNVFSRAKICCPLNVGRVCFFFPSLSTSAMPPGLTETRTVCLWIAQKLATMRSLASVITIKIVLQCFSYKILIYFKSFSVSGHFRVGMIFEELKLSTAFCNVTPCCLTNFDQRPTGISYTEFAINLMTKIFQSNE